MSEEARIQSFDEFWPFYVHEHRNPVNRALHYTGTTLVIGSVVTAAVTLNPTWLLAAPVAGYGFAWFGHFFIEKNKPASFSYPGWSLRADFKMYGMALRGKMRDEVERLWGESAGENAREAAKAETSAATNGHAATHV